MRTPDVIRGSTRLYPVIGSPVAQVRAPSVYNPYFERVGIDAVCVPLEVAEPHFATFLRTLFAAPNVPGAMITVPHKRAAVAAIDDYSMAVRIAGSCNAVVRRPDGSLYGDLFDGEGFVRGLRRWGYDPTGASCLVVGSGGVGAAIAAALAEARVRTIALHDVKRVRASPSPSVCSATFPRSKSSRARAGPAGYQMVVNGTPLGMRPDDPLPIDVTRLASSTIVADAVMKIDMTPLLREASSRGCRIQLGREMLFEQAPLYLEFFGFGQVAAEDVRPEA